MSDRFGDSVIVRRGIDGKEMAIDDQGRISIAGITVSGDLQIGAVEIKDSTTNDRANIRGLPSGDNGIIVIGGEVNPLHSSQANSSVIFQYNTSGDLIYIDKRLAGVTYRRATWKNDYTGDQVIDTTKSWIFGSWLIV
uniref:Tail protein n=1 Tax=viral metagenome TaxID=1070528 RepID=A0A6M3IQW7_9ZZZZ